MSRKTANATKTATIIKNGGAMAASDFVSYSGRHLSGQPPFGKLVKHMIVDKEIVKFIKGYEESKQKDLFFRSNCTRDDFKYDRKKYIKERPWLRKAILARPRVENWVIAEDDAIELYKLKELNE